MNNDYTANEITYLKDLEPVRKRFGMYIGAEETAMKQMLWEVIDNSTDEYLAGYNNLIEIKINSKDYIFEVRDYGRGIPTELHPVEKISTLELVLTKLHAGGKFGQSGYKFSGGLHGVGVSAVNALSNLFICESRRSGKIWRASFSKGLLLEPTHIIGDSVETGTYVKFIPDYELMPDIQMPTKEEIIERLKEIALLNINLTIKLQYDEEHFTFLETTFHKALYKYAGDFICEPICINKQEVSGELNKNFELDCMFTWSNTQHISICFTNGIKQAEGGDHLKGAQTAIVDILLKYIKEYQTKRNKKNPVVIADDIKQQLCIILSLKMVDPKFTSQTKEKLSSSDARNFVKRSVIPVFELFMEKNISISNTIIEKIIAIASIREESKKEKVNIKGGFGIPSSLAVCTSKNAEECELFIVEGDSAGGSARMGRNRNFQAVLPIQGKLLNVMRASPQKIYNSDSIKSLMASIGIEYNKPFDITRLRYHKIIILTDADTDGLHILTLLLIFFVQVCPQLILNGFIYVVYPPLYKVTVGKKVHYAQDNKELSNIMYDKFVTNYILTDENNTPLTAVKVQELYNTLHAYYKEVRSKNMHIDETLIMQLSYYSIDELCKILNSNVSIEYEDEKTKHIGIVSLYGYKKYVINKINPINSIEKIYYNNQQFNSIYNLYMFIHDNKNKHIMIQRFKGLGEMNPEELEVTCLLPNKRQLLQLNIPTDQIEDTIAKCQLIMDNTEERRIWLRQVLGIDIYDEEEEKVKIEYDDTEENE